MFLCVTLAIMSCHQKINKRFCTSRYFPLLQAECFLHIRPSQVVTIFFQPHEKWNVKRCPHDHEVHFTCQKQAITWASDIRPCESPKTHDFSSNTSLTSCPSRITKTWRIFHNEKTHRFNRWRTQANVENHVGTRRGQTTCVVQSRTYEQRDAFTPLERRKF